MKNLLVIAAVSIAASSAFASKARVAAIQNAAHANDIQDVFLKPDSATAHGEWATFEFGSTAGATTNSEGGFVRKNGDAAWGLYLGHTSSSITLIRTLASTGLSLTSTAQENPLNVFYGMKNSDMSWGVGLYYTNSDKKSTTLKQNAMGVTGSMTMGALKLWGKVGLANNVEQTVSSVAKKISGKTTLGVNAGYTMDTLYFHGAYDVGGAKGESGSTSVTDWEGNEISIGVVNSHKKDATDFFYGVSYNMSTIKEKVSSTKAEMTTLPVIIGIEADAANWLTFRASLTQNVLLGSNKNDTGSSIPNSFGTSAASSGESDTIANNTTVAAGVGMKWNKFIVDGVVQNSGTNGGAFGFDGTNFLGKVSMTYMF